MPDLPYFLKRWVIGGKTILAKSCVVGVEGLLRADVDEKCCCEEPSSSSSSSSSSPSSSSPESGSSPSSPSSSGSSGGSSPSSPESSAGGSSPASSVSSPGGPGSSPGSSSSSSSSSGSGGLPGSSSSSSPSSGSGGSPGSSPGSSGASSEASSPGSSPESSPADVCSYRVTIDWTTPDFEGEQTYSVEWSDCQGNRHATTVLKNSTYQAVYDCTAKDHQSYCLCLPYWLPTPSSITTITNTGDTPIWVSTWEGPWVQVDPGDDYVGASKVGLQSEELWVTCEEP